MGEIADYYSPVSNNVANACIAAVVDTGDVHSDTELTRY
jgi:hypothetical protein